MTGPPDARAQPADAPPAADAPAAEPPPPLVLEPRQRWRLTFARELPQADEIPTGREYIGRWESSLLASGLPVLLLASGRPRVALGAPLPSGCSAERELVEFWLLEPRPAWNVREAVSRELPSGHHAVDLENIWVGAPALSGQVAAAEYTVRLVASRHGLRDEVEAAVDRLMARDHVPRQRRKGGEARVYDLRPLLASLAVAGDAAGAVSLAMRTRIHPELGTGRPDEVVAAVADEAGTELRIERTVREQLLLLDEL